MSIISQGRARFPACCQQGSPPPGRTASENDHLLEDGEGEGYTFAPPHPTLYEGDSPGTMLF